MLPYIDLLQTFETEEDEDCSYDFLEVFDGSNGHSQSKSLKRLCGFVYPPTISSTGHSMFLHFVTDDGIGGFGFNVTYTIHNPLRKKL